MKKLGWFVILALIFSVSSCRKDFSSLPNTGKLTFSKDTVFLDTVFTNIGSSTYNLKVYNKSSRAISIPAIYLEKGNSSNYRLNVDGIPGKSFQNIDILANDSIYVFVETTVDVSKESDPLYTDKILFDNGINEQQVNLVTLVQDATFLYPGKDATTMKIDSLVLNGEPFAKGRFLTDAELTFTKQKPYVVYGYIAVPANKSLTIDAGAKIYFHNNSGLIIDKGASLKVNGTLAEQVVFEGDRLEHFFSDVAGQWSTIWLRAGSKDNKINYATIKNGVAGIIVDSIGTPSTPTLHIKNSQIYNHSAYGILGRQTNITGENVVIGNAGQASLAATIGGSYTFKHSTFANFWNNSSRNLPAVLVNNFYSYTDASDKDIIVPSNLTAATFINCIIDGNNNVEFVLDKIEGSTFNYELKNCMIRFDDVNKNFTNNAELNFNDLAHYNDIILNGTSNFKNPSENDFMIGQKNTGIGKALLSTALTIPLDILGANRTTLPDIGGYQHVVFE